MTTANELIVEVMREVQGVAKRDRNTAPNGGYTFRGIDAVVNAIGPALRKHGGFIVPRLLDYQSDTATTAKGSAMNVVRLTVEYAIHGTDGDPVTGVVAAEAFDSGDKATAKAMSVAFRTFMLQTFALPTDEPDPDSFSYDATVNGATGRDWNGDADKLATQADLRALWLEANQAKAPKKTLDYITKRAETVGV